MSTNHTISIKEASRKRQRLEITSSTAPVYKVRRILSSLPARLETKETTADDSKKQNPKGFLLDTLKARGMQIEIKGSLCIQDFFEDPTDKEIDAYDSRVLNAIRSGDIDELRRLHHEEGRPMKCSNRFGESLLHLACRRGLVDVASFLIKEAGVTVRVRDDYGRTPLHDACWTHTPNFELIELILGECPELLFMSDRRGHTPLCYAREHQWPAWVSFLREKEHSLFSNMAF